MKKTRRETDAFDNHAYKQTDNRKDGTNTWTKKKIREQFPDNGAPLPDEALEEVAGGEAIHLGWNDVYSKKQGFEKPAARSVLPPDSVSASFVPPVEKHVK